MSGTDWDRLWELFHQARELPEAERSKFLDAACAENAAQRQKLDLLISADDRTDDFLEQSMAPTLTGLVETEGEPADGEPREIGSYRLIERLGRGGMGVVWRAEHRMLRRPAAIKLIRADFSENWALGPEGDSENAAEDWCREQETLRIRFEREAQATAALSSPHTVALYDFGITDEGRCYYAMELLNGMTLEKLVKQFGPLPPERVIYLLRGICDSLADAHQRGMVHRDIKTLNLFVCRVGTQVDFVKVLDFGLVKTFMGSSEVSLTIQGATVGTPAFVSPEMIEGDEQVDGRADLYSLGCVAYRLLTGTHVFGTQSIPQMFRSHREEAPVPPSKRTDQAIPAALDAMILQCLEKDPDRRPENAEQVRRMLDACEAADPWTQERAREWWWKNHV